MSVSQKDVLRAAKLAKIKIATKDTDMFMSRIAKVFEWIEQLQEINVEGVPPLANPMEDMKGFKTPMRQDIVIEGECADAILSNAPKAEHHMFAVPKVIE